MEYYGVIGHPIEHSLSPLLHRMIYEQLGYPAEYSRFSVKPEQISGLIPAMRTLGLGGLNVTMPHKQAILPYLDIISPTAQAVGAVNTVGLSESGAWGDNTDGHGFVRSLSHFGVDATGKRFVLCGSSGAGRAVRHALEQAGAAEVLVASTRAEEGISYRQLAELEPRDVIVNCTPLGMHPREGESVVGEEVLRRFEVAVDLIYNPEETLFLRRASALGLTAFNGLWMLIYQGIRSFELWTGQDASGVDANAIYHGLKEKHT